MKRNTEEITTPAKGFAIQDGTGVAQNLAEAVTHLRRAAAQGHMQACFTLGIRDTTAIPLYSNILSSPHLGCLLEAGRGIDSPDVPAAINCYERAASKGDTRSKVNLGRLFERQHHAAVACKWYSEASQEGDQTASFNLATLYLNGEQDFPVNQELGIEFLALAAERGHPKAQYNFACRKLSGDGCTPDEAGAMELLEKSADAGLDKPAKLLRNILRLRKEREAQAPPVQGKEGYCHGKGLVHDTKPPLQRLLPRRLNVHNQERPRLGPLREPGRLLPCDGKRRCAIPGNVTACLIILVSVGGG